MNDDLNRFFVKALNEFHFTLNPHAEAVRCSFDEQTLELRSTGPVKLGAGILLDELKNADNSTIPILCGRLKPSDTSVCEFAVNGKLRIPSVHGETRMDLRGRLQIKARGENVEVVSCEVTGERPDGIVLPGNVRLCEPKVVLSYKNAERTFEVILNGRLDGASDMEIASTSGEATACVKLSFTAADPDDMRIETEVCNVRLSLLNEFEIGDARLHIAGFTKPAPKQPHAILVIREGMAGLFRKKDPQPGYYINVENVGARFTLSNEGFTATLSKGRLKLPDMFQSLKPGLCPNPGGGPAISLAQRSTLKLIYQKTSTGKGDLSMMTEGALRFSNIGFDVPQIPGCVVQVCSADLLIGKKMPALANVNGVMLLSVADRTARIDLRDGHFSLDGFPSMRVELGEDLELFNQDGFTFTLLGQHNKAAVDKEGRTIVSGMSIFPATAGTLPRIQLDGAIKLAVPLSDLANEDGSQVTGVVSGSLLITPKVKSAPELSFSFGTIEVGGTFRLGGASGVVIKDAKLVAQNVQNFFRQSQSTPFTVVLSGKILVPDGPGFGIKDAKFVFTDLQRPPKFVPGTMVYEEHQFALAKTLPLRVRKAELTFKDGTKRLPQLIEPENLRITTSASVSIPRDDPYFEGRVDNLVVTFNGDGSPEFRIGGIGLTIEGLNIPPIEELGGSVYIGGIESPETLFFAGRLAGSYNGAGVDVLLAFNPKGLIGACVDVNAGATGVPIDGYQLGGILITGGSVGLSLVNSSEDPCAFSTYVGADGRPKSSLGSFPVAAMTWEQLRDAVAQKKRALAVFGAPPALPVPGVGAGPERSEMLVNIERTPPANNDFQIPCPGDCPPPTINIFCQPHPDQITFPNLVIAKFSSFDEAALNKLGITESSIASLLQAGGRTAVAIASDVAQRLRTAMNMRLPRPNNTFAKATEVNKLLDDSLNTVQMLFADKFKNAIAGKTTAREIYNAIRDAAYRGAPCPDVTLKATGTMTHQYVSSFLSCTGGAVISTAGSAGIAGNLNLIGMPVGKLRGFISATDAKGDPNPSLCGQVDFAVGPLHLGTLRASFKCEGCVTTLLNQMADLTACVSDDVVRQAAARVLPSLDTRNLSKKQIVGALKDSRSKMTFVTGLLSIVGTQQQKDCLLNCLRGSLNAINPEVLMCGEVQAKLFGIPLGKEVGAVAARVNKQEFIASMRCSPLEMFSLALYYAAPNPAAAMAVSYGGLFLQDKALLSFRVELPSVDQMILDGVEGNVRSTTDVLRRAQESFDYLLEHGVYAMKYELSPLGFKTLDAQWRVLVPDLLNHPARFSPSRWTMPEKRVEGLPSRVDVLIASLNGGRLADPRWNGNAQDFAEIFPHGDPRREKLRGLSLRKDYFPHGGHVGALKLQMPQALAEAPAPELFVVRNQNASVKDRFEAACSYIKDHVLRNVEIGSLSFYVPAPNPPSFVDERGRPLSSRNLLESMNRLEGKTATLRKDLKSVESQKLYPSELFFLRGYFEGSLLGFPVGKAEIVALPPDPPSRPIGCFRVAASVPKDSWFRQFVDQANLIFELKQSPSKSIEERFNGLLELAGKLRQSGTNEQTLRNFMTNDLPKALSEGLPKVSLEAKVDVRVPEGSILKRLVEIQKEPGADTNTNVTLFAYSPCYEPANVGTGAVAQARRDGGIAIRVSRLKLGRQLGFDASIDNAELSLRPPGPQQPAKITGQFENVTVDIAGGALKFVGSLAIDSDPNPAKPYLTAFGTLSFQLSLASWLNVSTALPGASFVIERSTHDWLSASLSIAPFIADLSKPFASGAKARVFGGAPNGPLSVSLNGDWEAQLDLPSCTFVDPNGQSLLRIEKNQAMKATLKASGLQSVMLAIELPLVSLTFFPGQDHRILMNPSATEKVIIYVGKDGTFRTTAMIPALQIGRFVVHGGGGASSPVFVRVDQNGMIVGGSNLTVQGIPNGTLSLNQFTIRPDGSFEVSAGGLTIETSDLQLTSGSVTLRRSQSVASLSLKNASLSVPRFRINRVNPDVTLSTDGITVPVSEASFGPFKLQGSGSVKFDPAQPASTMRLRFDSGSLSSSIPGWSQNIAVAGFDLFAASEISLPDLNVSRARLSSTRVKIWADGNVEIKGRISKTDSFPLPPIPQPDKPVEIPVWVEPTTKRVTVGKFVKDVPVPGYWTTRIELQPQPPYQPPPIDVAVDLGELTMTYNSATDKFETTVRKEVKVEKHDFGWVSYRISISSQGLTVTRN